MHAPCTSRFHYSSTPPAARPPALPFHSPAARPPALQGFVAGPGRIAFEIVAGFAVRPQAVKRMLAPEGAVIAGLNGGIPFGLNVQPLPLQIGAAIHADPGVAGPLHAVKPFRRRPPSRRVLRRHGRVGPYSRSG